LAHAPQARHVGLWRGKFEAPWVWEVQGKFRRPLLSSAFPRTAKQLRINFGAVRIA